MLFDTHAHLDDRAFDTDRIPLLEALPRQGIALVMNPGCSAESSRNRAFSSASPASWPDRPFSVQWPNLIGHQ